ncbi:MAG: CopG family transcriptional regulator [Acidobacteria bacterium]|nr:MAG: CopG family transcriptional regulator [Acidobacteriota bacterium]
MIRTVISLDEESKEWLDQQAREENISAAELIRTAVRKYREEKKREAIPLNDLLKQTTGMWKAGDGLTYQRRLRKEWQK